MTELDALLDDLALALPSATRVYGRSATGGYREHVFRSPDVVAALCGARTDGTARQVPDALVCPICLGRARRERVDRLRRDLPQWTNREGVRPAFRRKVLAHIEAGPCTVADVVQATGLSQPTVRRVLKDEAVCVREARPAAGVAALWGLPGQEATA